MTETEIAGRIQCLRELARSGGGLGAMTPTAEYLRDGLLWALDEVERLREARQVVPPWWHCDLHGPGKHSAWGCPDCTREMREENKRLRYTIAHAARELETLDDSTAIAQAAALRELIEPTA